MSGSGYVTTARGETLNMDQLIGEQTKRPLTKTEKAALKSEVQPVKRPRIPINVRGYMPASGQEKVPQAQMAPAGPRARCVYPEAPDGGTGEEPRSVSDFTRIRVDKPRRIKQKPESAEQVSEEILGDIMDELEANAPHSQDAVESAERENMPEKGKPRKKT